MLLDTPVVRFASMSIFKLVLLTVALCSRGAAGMASAGKAEEKDHSSSSCAAGLAIAAVVGVAGLELNVGEARAAKGSTAGAGGAKADD